MTKLTRAEAFDLFEFLDEDDYELFELMPARNGKPAKVLKLRGASAAEYVKFVVRRIPAVAASYVDNIATGLEQARIEAEAKEAASRTASEDVPFGTRRQAPAAGAPAVEAAPAPAAPVDPIAAAMIATVRGNIAEGGLEEKAALVAVCAGYPGDDEFEARIISHPRFPALAARASFKTRGADPFAFSAGVAALVLETGMDPEPAPEPEASPTAA